MNKRWKLWVIFIVIALTLYNILPTLFFYAKPLKSPIDQDRAKTVACEIASRVDKLENEAVKWLISLSKHLGLGEPNVSVEEETGLIAVTFLNESKAATFRSVLPKAGSLIPFAPSQLSLSGATSPDSKTVWVQRTGYLKLLPEDFAFSFKDANEGPSELYQTISQERKDAIVSLLEQPYLKKANLNALTEDDLLLVSKKIALYDTRFSSMPDLQKRLFSSLLPAGIPGAQLIAKFEKIQAEYNEQIKTLSASQDAEKGRFLSSQNQEKLQLLNGNQTSLAQAIDALKRHQEALALPCTSPIINKVDVDFAQNHIILSLYPDVQRVRLIEPKTEQEANLKDAVGQLLADTASLLEQRLQETARPSADGFDIALTEQEGCKSFLAIDLNKVGNRMKGSLAALLQKHFTPNSADLDPAHYPVMDFATYSTLKGSAKKLGFVVVSGSDAPASYGFKKSAVYVIAKSFGKFLNESQGDARILVSSDLRSLASLFQPMGFVTYLGNDAFSSLAAEFEDDLIFELDPFYDAILMASREAFSSYSMCDYSLLEFTDVEQRILAEGKIETLEQEDLLRAQDEYRAAKVRSKTGFSAEIPPPTHSPFWNNLVISTKKYFSGDSRKVLRWGMDLTGGKTVLIGLKDQNNRPITTPADLKEAVNQLTERVNKLGVSEVAIKIEGERIAIDFPGSQNLSAQELIQASSMTFHVVNEKFGRFNPSLNQTVNLFLQEVWNEAVLTGRKDIHSLNEIAYVRLMQATDTARNLREAGLAFADPNTPMSAVFNDTLSMVAPLKGTDYSDWQGQTHPLVITFRNYALQGVDLTDVQGAYSPTEGNFLSFNIASSRKSPSGEKLSPQEDFYNWTSTFCQDKVSINGLDSYSLGKGWRMAVILNGNIVCAPSLNSALKDRAQITGNFSQREINSLVADLKAGSLSFTPVILSEQNISPDLGQSERVQGIVAACIALAAVIIMMISYYRFAGLIASIAVLFNLLILWGVLQNLGAALTLPGIGGIVLTIGMAVDANVLVFERIREELHGQKAKLAYAVHAGYKKAFSAILDSNLTTILAGLILMHFGSGAVKGLAVTLIVGIVSSMFTALFMTRVFFEKWVEKPGHKMLTMAKFLTNPKVPFFKFVKPVWILSIIVAILGCITLYTHRQTLFGMDFTGGYAIHVTVENSNNENLRENIAEALQKAGAQRTDFQIRQLSLSNAFKIQLGNSMEEKGHPFYDMPTSIALDDNMTYSYETNPRITWLVSALSQEGITLVPSTLTNLDQNWSEMSGQLSESMRTDAIIALSIALIGVLIYIAFRFEWKYAAASTLGLVYVVLMTLAISAILHAIGVNLQFDLQAVAALLTIIGYSLNDTIIVFDRIREEVKERRRMRFKELAELALNTTLSRTIMTSGTTFVVLLALVLFGGQSIFSFSLMMAIGVLVGTYSSLVVATPLLWLFQEGGSSKSARSIKAD